MTRIAAIFLTAALLVFSPARPSLAEDGGDTASDQAATSASDKAAATAADEASSAAADQAASTAADQASSSAADQASSDAADQASSSAADQAESSASEKAAESASDQAESSAVARTQDGQGDDVAERASNSGGDSAANSEDGNGSAEKDAEAAPVNGPGNGDSDGKSQSAAAPSDTAARADLERVTASAPIDVAKDEAGNDMRANEIVVMLSQAEDSRLRAMGYAVLGQQSLGTLGGEIVRLRVAGGSSPSQALAAIAQAVPGAVAASNHLYRVADRSSQVVGKLHRAAHGKPDADLNDAVVGVIDTPVDRAYPELGNAVVETRSFADGAQGKSVHGTAVAELIARQKLRVDAANVFSSDVTGQDAATTDAIVAAIDWLVSKGVPVINMSIEGPDNAALREAVRRAESKGVAIVAAAGNDGPAAPPVYPAALPGVVAVTAIDSHDQVYRYANRGAYISFAALGVDVDTALPPKSVQRSSGTSFAAPVVSGLLARLSEGHAPFDMGAALDTLKKSARHLGEPGRNAVFGYGALDMSVPIKRMAARPQSGAVALAGALP